MAKSETKKNNLNIISYWEVLLKPTKGYSHSLCILEQFNNAK